MNGSSDREVVIGGKAVVIGLVIEQWYGNRAVVIEQ